MQKIFLKIKIKIQPIILTIDLLENYLAFLFFQKLKDGH